MERNTAQPNIIKRVATAGMLAATAMAGASCMPHEVQAAQEFCSTKPDAVQCLGNLAAFANATSDPSLRRAQEINASQAPSDQSLARLRQCESNGNYGIVNSTGTYRGAYQFSQSTWNNVAKGVANLPAYVGKSPNSSPAIIQDAMARSLFKIGGRGPWPVCGKRI